MVNPKAHTLIDVFLPDGFGAFGFGQGGFGGSYDLLNPQWNTNSGNFGLDQVVGLPYVEATSTPSYIGATTYDISYDSFFAKIEPAPNGGGSIQTALVVKFDAINYVEMSVGPTGVFSAYGSNNNNIVYTASAIPAYDPTAHAFWRIRNDGVVFHFDVSPDGSTWTELGNVPYTWDASNVTIMVFAGFNGSEQPGNRAYISNVNLPGTTLALSATTYNSASFDAYTQVTQPYTLSGGVEGKFGVRANFQASLGIPQGGLTDMGISNVYQDIDPMMAQAFGAPAAVTTGANPVTKASWALGFEAGTAPSQYRDGTFWPAAEYATTQLTINTLDNVPVLLTNFQTEIGVGLNNRLNLSSFIYLNSNPYAPGPGVSSAYRTTTTALTGNYSYQINSTTSPGTDGASQLAYWLWPTSVSLTPVKQISSQSENLFGSIYLSTQRANTQWYASFVFYDANYNILNISSYQNPVSYAVVNTHPGGGVWQVGNVNTSLIIYPSGTAYVGVIPVIRNPSSLAETVYVSNNTVVGSTFYSGENTNYQHPNTMEVNIKADRVNYVLNGGFNTNVNGWSQVNNNTTGSPSPVTLSWDGATGFQSLGCAKMTFVSQSGTFSGNSTSQLGMSSPYVYQGGAMVPIIQGLKPGHTYTFSAWIKQGIGCPDVQLQIANHNFSAGSVFDISTNAAKSAGNTINGWTQVSYTWTIPFQALPDWALYFYVNYTDYIAAGQNFSFWVDDLLVEESALVGSFFDGNTSTSDYMWESGGTANFSRSYYYKNYSNKLTRLNKELPNVMPLGSYYNLLFAQPITTT